MAACERLAGITGLTIDGNAYMVVSDVTWSPGQMEARDPGRPRLPSGFSEVPIQGFIEATLRDSGDISVGDFNDMRCVEVMVTLANGKVVGVIEPLWNTAALEVRAAEARFKSASTASTWSLSSDGRDHRRVRRQRGRAASAHVRPRHRHHVPEKASPSLHLRRPTREATRNAPEIGTQHTRNPTAYCAPLPDRARRRQIAQVPREVDASDAAATRSWTEAFDFWPTCSQPIRKDGELIADLTRFWGWGHHTWG